MHVADFVGLNAKVAVVYTEKVPKVELGIGDFPIREEILRLHTV